MTGQGATIILSVSDIAFIHQCLTRLVNVNQSPIALSTPSELRKIEFLDGQMWHVGKAPVTPQRLFSLASLSVGITQNTYPAHTWATKLLLWWSLLFGNMTPKTFCFIDLKYWPYRNNTDSGLSNTENPNLCSTINKTVPNLLVFPYHCQLRH